MEAHTAVMRLILSGYQHVPQLDTFKRLEKRMCLKKNVFELIHPALPKTDTFTCHHKSSDLDCNITVGELESFDIRLIEFKCSNQNEVS